MNTYGELYNASKKRLAGQMQVLNLSLFWKRWGGFFCSVLLELVADPKVLACQILETNS